MKEETINKIRENELNLKSNLKDYACKDTDAKRYKESTKDIRLEFQRDIDKIVYSNAYTRYLGKTQVYTLKEEDHISRRSTHVQFVSRVSRTIARALGLNEDLCEAIALGHDIGHVPFGHEGERVLSKISQKYTGKVFAHNVQSVRAMQVLGDNGKGLNLTMQVLDGILCHNVEFLCKEYRPVKKNLQDLKNEYFKCYESEENIKKLVPMTLEGCVVRISDVIAYIGKDIEDAITLGVLERESLPEILTKVIGNKNSDIMDHIILDIVESSYEKDYISMSEDMFDALKKLMKFNYENIYGKAYTEEEKLHCKEMFEKLFEIYLKALIKNDQENDIVKVFLKNMSNEYIESNSKERIVIDFIAGMTDRYMFSQYGKYCLK